jgi:hypothetical protein
VWACAVTAQLVLEGLAGDVDRAVRMYEGRLAGHQSSFERLQADNVRLQVRLRHPPPLPTPCRCVFGGMANLVGR